LSIKYYVSFADKRDSRPSEKSKIKECHANIKRNQGFNLCTRQCRIQKKKLNGIIKRSGYNTKVYTSQ
jgi:hypothetical protein